MTKEAYPYSAHRMLTILEQMGIKAGVMATLDNMPNETAPENCEPLSSLKELTPEEDGLLTVLPSDCPTDFFLFLMIHRGRVDHTKVAVVFNKKRSLQEKKSDITPGTDWKTVSLNVTSRPIDTENGWPGYSTKHIVNGLRIIRTENGVFQMWEIAIPTRIINNKAHFFLTIEKLYEGRMYNLDGQVHVPESQYEGFSKWPELRNLVETMVEPESLPEMEKNISPYCQKLPDKLPDNVGIVKYFCLASGVGKATTNKGEGFIHWQSSRIESNTRFAHLAQGQLISFRAMTLNGENPDPLISGIRLIGNRPISQNRRISA